MKCRQYAAVASTLIFLSFSLAQTVLGQQKYTRQPDYRIGFSLTPDSVSHQGNEGMRGRHS